MANSKYAEILEQSSVPNKVWKTALYLRLSRDDGSEAESNSIASQREILKEYVNRYQDMEIYDIYLKSQSHKIISLDKSRSMLSHAYLLECSDKFLLEKGYEVHGLLRRHSISNTARIDHLIRSEYNKVKFFLHFAISLLANFIFFC